MTRRTHLSQLLQVIPKLSPDRATVGPSPAAPSPVRPIGRHRLVEEVYDAGLVVWEQGGRVLRFPNPAELAAHQSQIAGVVAKLAKAAERATERLRADPRDTTAQQALQEALIVRTGLLLETRRAVGRDVEAIERAVAAGAPRPPLPPLPRSVPAAEMTLSTARGLAVARLRFDPRLADSHYAEDSARLDTLETTLFTMSRFGPSDRATRAAAMLPLVVEQRRLHTFLRGRETALIHQAVHFLQESVEP